MSDGTPYFVRVIHNDDLYEALVRDNTILSITKFIGASQMPRPTDFDHLCDEVKCLIIEEISNHNEE